MFGKKDKIIKQLEEEKDALLNKIRLLADTSRFYEEDNISLKNKIEKLEKRKDYKNYDFALLYDRTSNSVLVWNDNRFEKNINGVEFICYSNGELPEIKIIK